MSRNPVHVRDATPADAASLLQVWEEFSRRGAERCLQGPGQVQASMAIARAAADRDERILVGTFDSRVVGAVHLRRAPISPIHTEQAVFASHLHVLEDWRRHGVGRALLEAATRWAEEMDVQHLVGAAAAASRDANRFLARLGLAQIAIVRGASVAMLRSKMPVEPPPAAQVSSRNQRVVGQLIAQRRSQRRAQTKVS